MHTTVYILQPIGANLGYSNHALNNSEATYPEIISGALIFVHEFM